MGFVYCLSHDVSTAYYLHQAIVGSLSNYDDDDNVKKQLIL